ncbi:MAG: tyrosine-type recombinase/integrase [Candidatus Moranbacteria bacterium]|nr:tyrosine-type recombinase/integrase [Candidatus Moranbacteria bacterium]
MKFRFPSSKKYLLSECFGRYFDRVEADGLLAPRSIEKYREVSGHLLRYLGDTDVRRLDDVAITRLKHRLAEEGLSPSRKNHYLVVLKNVLGFLRKTEGMRTYDPEKIGMFRIRQKEVTYLTREQVNRLADHLGDSVTDLRLKAVIESLFSTGCRISELLSLGRSQLDFKTGVVAIRTKGDKPHRIIFNETSRCAIRKYLERRNDSCEALFATAKTAVPKRLQVNDVERSLRNLGKKLGYPVSVTPHLIRRSAATHLFRSGAPLGVIQGFLNHSSSQVTTRFYLGSPDFEDLREAHGRFMDSKIADT